eukprot:s5854_g4.t1
MLHGIFFLKPTRNAEVRLAKLWTHSDLGRKARWSHFLQGLVRPASGPLYVGEQRRSRSSVPEAPVNTMPAVVDEEL